MFAQYLTQRASESDALLDVYLNANNNYLQCTFIYIVFQNVFRTFCKPFHIAVLYQRADVGKARKQSIEN